MRKNLCPSVPDYPVLPKGKNMSRKKLGSIEIQVRWLPDDQGAHTLVARVPTGLARGLMLKLASEMMDKLLGELFSGHLVSPEYLHVPMTARESVFNCSNECAQPKTGGGE